VIAMKNGWLLYDRRDYEINQGFATHVHACAKAHDLSFTVIFTEDFDAAVSNPPDFVISRQRNPLLSRQMEAEGIPVFNSSRVCELCNDKRETHQFLDGLPLMHTAYVSSDEAYGPSVDAYPLVVKPAFGHGGDRVVQVHDNTQLNSALAAITPQPALVQETASDAGRDLRIYVVFGRIIAAVLRQAQDGIISNYKRGGHVSLHVPTAAEQTLAQQVIDRFSDYHAPLSFAGIDLIYHHGSPVINEVEDVVGSRMLYKVSDIDIISLYIDAIADQLSHDK